MHPVHTPALKVANGGGGAGEGGGGGGGEGGGLKIMFLKLREPVWSTLTSISPLLTVSFWSRGEGGCW